MELQKGHGGGGDIFLRDLEKFFSFRWLHLQVSLANLRRVCPLSLDFSHLCEKRAYCPALIWYLYIWGQYQNIILWMLCKISHSFSFRPTNFQVSLSVSLCAEYSLQSSLTCVQTMTTSKHWGIVFIFEAIILWFPCRQTDKEVARPW